MRCRQHSTRGNGDGLPELLRVNLNLAVRSCGRRVSKEQDSMVNIGWIDDYFI